MRLVTLVVSNNVVLFPFIDSIRFCALPIFLGGDYCPLVPPGYAYGTVTTVVHLPDLVILAVDIDSL